MAKVPKVPTTLPQRLADAALKIARANHYLVGFDPETTAGISFDDWSDAYQELITRENASTYPLVPRTRLNLAFAVLSTACYRQHRTHLSN